MEAALPGIPTTSSQGARNAKYTDFSPVAKRPIIVCVDNDDVGKHHAEDVAARAIAAGATSVKIIHFPFAPPKGDVLEWLDAGGNSDTFQLLIESAEPSDISSIPLAATGNGRIEETECTPFTPLPWSCLTTLAADERPWLVTHLARPGWLIALLGHGKEGKTTLALHLMASLASTRSFVGHTVPHAKPTMYLSFEMSREDLGDYVRPIQAATTFDVEPQALIDLPVPLKLTDLERCLREQPEPGLVVIDSFRGAFMLGRDGEKDAGVIGGILRGLQRMARETNWTILVIHHQRKSGTGDFLDGSDRGDWLAAPDAVWTWTRPNGNEVGTLRVTGRLPHVDPISIKLSPTCCAYVGAASTTEADFSEDAILRHIPQTSPGLTPEAICAGWGEEAPAFSTLKMKLDRMSAEQSPRVQRSGTGRKGKPHRYWQSRVSSIPIPSIAPGGIEETVEEVVTLDD